jgi:hypothetical protein
MRKIVVGLAAALATAAIAVTPALAAGTTTVDWDGQGSEKLPCAGNEHWVLAPAQGVTSATLHLDGTDYGMNAPNGGNGAWDVFTNIGFDGSQSASVTYSFSGEDPESHLQLSACDKGSSTTGGTDTGGTDTTTGGTDTTTGGTDTTTGGTDTTTGGTDTTTGGTTTTTTGGVSGGTTGGTTGGTAATPTGGNLPFTGLPVWVPLLAAAAMFASGIFLVRRRKGEVS